MTAYAAPLPDLTFVLHEVVGLAEIASLPGSQDASPELVDQVLAEAARFAENELAPLNRSGDVEGSILENGAVRTPQGFAAAYRRFVDGGWNSVPFDPTHGGQGLPWILQTALMEMWNAANLSFSLCPLLNQGATELLSAHGSEAQKRLFLPKMISGEWSGSMNLTEPQAGSDLGAIKTKAVRDGDDYRIVGQKVFITYGEHDFTANIVHLVLARVRGAPPGSKGISLFIVPKFLVKNDGSLGERNDLRCVSLEHKLGIAASPTCVMAYGDGGGAVGYLVGEENRGLEYMFTMMNNARLAVGLEGVAIAERAYQQARAYARQRVQGRDVAGSGGPVPIVRHPDVRRMLLFMKAGTEAARALTLKTAAWLDLSRRSPDARFRREAQAAVDLLIPVVKGWCTDLGVEIASVGIQVHGGVGFVEETGAAQYYRDARILPIYEGTNGIQAHDLLSRKLIRDGGAALATLVERMETTAARLDRESGDDLAAMRRRLVDGIAALRSASRWLLDVSTRDIRLAASGASPFMRLLGIVAGGWLMVESALAAARMLAENRGDATFLRGKIVTARFFADQILSQAAAIGTQVASGASISAIADEQF